MCNKMYMNKVKNKLPQPFERFWCEELGEGDSVVCSKKTCKSLFCILQSTSRDR